MSCSTGVLLLHALQQLRARLEDLGAIYPWQRGVACETNVHVLHVWIQFHEPWRSAHITVYDVTTWSWVNLVNPVSSLVPRPFPAPVLIAYCKRSKLEPGTAWERGYPVRTSLARVFVKAGLWTGLVDWTMDRYLDRVLDRVLDRCGAPQRLFPLRISYLS